MKPTLRQKPPLGQCCLSRKRLFLLSCFKPLLWIVCLDAVKKKPVNNILTIVDENKLMMFFFLENRDLIYNTLTVCLIRKLFPLFDFEQIVYEASTCGFRMAAIEIIRYLRVEIVQASRERPNTTPSIKLKISVGASFEICKIAIKTFFSWHIYLLSIKKTDCNNGQFFQACIRRKLIVYISSSV